MQYDRHVIIIDGVEQSGRISHAITVSPPFVQRYFPLLRKYSATVAQKLRYAKQVEPDVSRMAYMLPSFMEYN